MEAKLSTVAMVGHTEVRGGGCPERTAAVGISLVLLQQLQVLDEEDPLTDHCHSNFLQMVLLHTHTHTIF